MHFLLYINIKQAVLFRYVLAVPPSGTITLRMCSWFQGAVVSIYLRNRNFMLFHIIIKIIMSSIMMLLDVRNIMCTFLIIGI